VSAGVSTAHPDAPSETRGQRIWNRVRDNRHTAKLSLERARLITASYKETEGLPVPIRRAKAFEKIVSGIPIYIDDEQLLAGDFASRSMWAEWYPETAVDWVFEDLATGDTPYVATEQEMAEQREIAEYWKNRTVEYAFSSTMSDEEKQRLSEVADKGAYVYRVLFTLDKFSSYHVVYYEHAINKGLLGIIAEIEEELRATPVLDDDSYAKTNFLNALVTAYKAAIQYSHRYAALAREMAKTAQGRRAQELEKMAQVCEWVPAHRARNFHEALQTMWFCHVSIVLEMFANGMSPGRADQYLYPYYKADIDEGRLTREEVIDLLECLRVKMSALRDYATKFWREGTSGEAQFHNIVLGGLKPDGSDATNELSYLFMEAAFRTRSPHHTLSIRYHPHTPDAFLARAAELAATGNGWPAFFNDEGNMKVLMDMGASLEEARGYALGGCLIPVIPGKSQGMLPLPFHTPQCLELALYDGVDPFTGKQIGPKTGKFKDFKTYDELIDAYMTQVRHFLNEAAPILNRQRCFKEAMTPPIFFSGLTDGCIKSGKSGAGAAPRYHFQHFASRGMIDTADSLAAIKKCVYEDGSLSKEGLIDALNANFEGKEEIRKLLLSAPKFGNDDDYVDSIANDLYQQWKKAVVEIDAPYGRKYLACTYSASGHHAAGKRVMALPSGRMAGASLADGSVSPCQGVDFKGPTAVIKSAGKIDQFSLFTTLLNVKFQPAAVKTKEDLKKFVALIRTYFSLGGRHIQFNVVDRKTLIEAQVRPEQHRNLMVRVAGYSAVFTELNRGVQDEVIQRTQHAL
jgi:pyruvate formate-lyase/glycerol dehydratase family glycyl radical enzyme